MKVQELFDLTGDVVLVTGGGRGLGEAMARAFAEAGARVVIASRKRDVVQKTAEAMRRDGFEVLDAGLDVTNPAEIDAVVDLILDRFGRIDVLVNNSGTSWGGPAVSMPLSAWQKVMDVNVTGTFASVAGLGGMDARVLDAVGYNASKGAVIAMTRDLAHKWAPHHIRVNAIAPGWFPTKMSQPVLDQTGDFLTQLIPLRRYGTMDDIKGVALLLASRASDYMTGAVLVVDGGTVS